VEKDFWKGGGTRKEKETGPRPVLLPYYTQAPPMGIFSHIFTSACNAMSFASSLHRDSVVCLIVVRISFSTPKQSQFKEKVNLT